MSEKPDVALPRTVKPRFTRPKRLPIVAVRLNEAVTETGIVCSDDTFLASLAHREPTIVATKAGAALLVRLEKMYGTDPNWNWRASANERDIYAPDRKLAGSRVTTVVHWFGWKGGNYHLILDPVTFYGRSLDEVWAPDGKSDLLRLMEWAVTLRDWCYQQGLDLKPTNGAVAAQFLRSSRFYSEPRRKVPQAINDRTRDNLPGNHYRLFASVLDEREYSAIYLDQRRAHHHHARTTPLPSSNYVFAHGRFLDLDGIVADRTWTEFYGLYCLLLRNPPRPTTYVPHFIGATDDGVYSAFVYSNEIGLLQDFGYTIEGVIAAWGGKHRDTGIPAFARYAEEQLNEHGAPAWLKPILLTTYGILAVRPKPIAHVYRRAKRGEPVRLPAGREWLHGLLVGGTNGRKVESGIANVLQRGLIEAATRAESLGFAHYLACQGHNVLSIYADAVIIEDEGKDLPLLPEPWEVRARLNHLKFVNRQAFTSGEMTKLPGISTRSEHLRASRGTYHAARQSTAPGQRNARGAVQE